MTLPALDGGGRTARRPRPPGVRRLAWTSPTARLPQPVQAGDPPCCTPTTTASTTATSGTAALQRHRRGDGGKAQRHHRKRGTYLVWLNGRYLGSAPGGVQADSDPVNPIRDPVTFPIPAGLVRPGEPAVLSVLVETWDTTTTGPPTTTGSSNRAASSARRPGPARHRVEDPGRRRRP